MVKNIRRHNRVVQIKDENDDWISNPQQIKHFTIHFQKLYEDDQPHTAEKIHLQLKDTNILVITDQQRMTLDQPIKDEEILQVVRQMGSFKALGPDGIPTAFYQKFWPTVKTDILNMVKAFFHSGFLLRSLNHTYITLIPKVPTPERVTQFRPISLCNVTYKIISKVLINRLKPFMDFLITPYQNAFIRGRKIIDNIILAHEVFEYLKKKQKGK